MKRPPVALEVFLWPIAILYAAVMRLRNILFDQGWLRSYSLAKPVISIGNLTAGGTGKTPLTAFLLESWRARGLSCGIVSRGYGGSEKGPARVPSRGGAESARRFGDEPIWFAERFPNVPVVVGADRVAAAESLLKQSAVDLILADDAFQHRRLLRDFDIVIIDASAPAWQYRGLPLGRMREGFASLRRAHAVVLTKVNLAETTQLAWLKERCANSLRPGCPMVEFSARIRTLVPLSGGAAVSANGFDLKSAILVAAIGQPQAFRRLLEKERGETALELLEYPDHHELSLTDRATIESRAHALGARAIVVTEKDAVKLDGWRPALPCWVSQFEFSPLADLGGFYDAALAATGCKTL